MKDVISYRKLRSILKEAKAPKDAEHFSSFKDEFFDNVFEESAVDLNVLKDLIDKQLSNKWEAYEGDNAAMLTLNVKGYGLGNWKLFNKDDRATEKNISIEEYVQYIQTLNTDFFYNWDATFKKRFGLNLYSAGRMNGHWGFKLKDLVYRAVVVNEDALKKIYDEVVKSASEEDIDYPIDLADEAYSKYIQSEKDVSKYIKLSDSFVKLCDAFEAAVKETSERFESKEFNDEFFNQFDL